MFTTPINATGKLTPPREGPEGAAPAVSKEALPKATFTQEAQPETQTAPLSEDTVEVSPKATALAPPEAEENKPTPQEEYTERIRGLVEEAQGRVTSLQFQIDSEGGDTVVKVVNRESGETLREIPSEEMRDLQERLREMKGILLRDTS